MPFSLGVVYKAPINQQNAPHQSYYSMLGFRAKVGYHKHEREKCSKEIKGQSGSLFYYYIHSFSLGSVEFSFKFLGLIILGFKNLLKFI